MSTHTHSERKVYKYIVNYKIFNVHVKYLHGTWKTKETTFLSFVSATNEHFLCMCASGYTSVGVWECVLKFKCLFVCIYYGNTLLLYSTLQLPGWSGCLCSSGAWALFKFGQMLKEGTKHVLSSPALATEVLTAISSTFFVEAMLMMMLIFRFVSNSSSPGSVKERVLDNLWLCKYYRRIC